MEINIPITKKEVKAMLNGDFIKTKYPNRKIRRLFQKKTKTMGVLASIYLKEETLETLLKTVKAKKEKGVSLTVSINDKTDNYGQNVSVFVSQSKEDREANKPRYYTGNGKVTWTNGSVSLPEKVEAQPKQTASVEEDLPF